MRKYAIRGAVSKEADEALAEFSPLKRKLFFHRGIASAAEAQKFLSPDYEAHMHNPFELKGMEKAVERILKAVADDGKVVIWSDYDADGIPGAVVLHDFFKKIGYANFQNYIPDRHFEGFGLNSIGIEGLAKEGAKLMITIDCGIADVKEVARANELGIEVIITDHHLPSQAGLPDAFAILNPKQADCAYPEKMLCGSGVVFKLVQALCLRLRSDLKIEGCKLKIPEATFPIGWEKWLLDMVGIATLSDMVPLLGENRVLAHYGLKVLRKSPRVGLGQLLRELRVNRQELSEDDIGFTISPRINAASRMGLPMDAFKLFATTDEGEAGVLAKHLNKINDERKGKVASLVKEVRKIVSGRDGNHARKVIVLGNPSWRPALLGLVANALVEDYRKPVFVWGREGLPAQAGGEAVLKGSCRSDGSVDVNALMHEARHALVEFGGHREAGGFSITLPQVALLEGELEVAYERVRKERAEEVFEYADTAISIEEVTWDLWRDIEPFAPFGVGNPKPVFLVENAPLSAVRRFGKEKQHLELVFEKPNHEKVSAISFFVGEDESYARLAVGGRVNFAATLERSTYRNFPELRLRIVNILL